MIYVSIVDHFMINYAQVLWAIALLIIGDNHRIYSQFQFIDVQKSVNQLTVGAIHELPPRMKIAI